MAASDLDFALCVSCGQVFRWELGADGAWFGVDGEHWYRVTLTEHGRSVRYAVESNADAAAFRALFRLDVSLETVEREVVRLGPELAPYVGSLQGLRLMHPSCAREVLFSFLCTANNNLGRIVPMVRYLGSVGEPMGEGATRFPSMERIAMLSEAELREAGFGYRAGTIPGVARQILERGEQWWAGLGSLDYSELHSELVSLKSVGPKLADCIALFGFHQDLAAPMDTHLWQACCRHYFPEWAGKPLTDQRYRTAAEFLRERFGPWTGWAHQYLFYDNLLNWRTRGKPVT